ncbi:hypothetical protein QBZ16_001558 [Prototheca wickerhamii]|uniref:Raptor N-terminal CASPase-like domain-containing protein n=1 Tax=Prototheca wickerhamii TaxID=3111 RepID=A0AAD9IGG1_PROWI|nr:hypothetical protein QBZ16_001558 [Prototheca wickerhamii]
MDTPTANLGMSTLSIHRVAATLEKLISRVEDSGSPSQLTEELSRRLHIQHSTDASVVEEDEDVSPYPAYYLCDLRHDASVGLPAGALAAGEGLVSKWRQKERLKTTAVALVVCLNIGVDPPDVVRVSPCARTECWIDPLSMPAAKALDAIGKSLQVQYERWQPRAKYKMHLDPTTEDVKRLAVSCRKNARSERVLFHYNGHGVPRPTANGEIWVFNRSYTQYIPLSLFDLQSWVGTPAIYVFDCSNAGQILASFRQYMLRQQQHQAAVAALEDARGGAAPAPEDPMRSNILLCACGVDDVLPQSPDLPADLFTACLTTPIKVSLKWFWARAAPRWRDALPDDELRTSLADRVPGQQTDRKTPLGELNWIFTAITDTIAWNVLPRALFQRLFRQDLLVASLFRNFLLADRVLRAHGCTPVSHPRLPATHQHPMWQAWDMAAEMCLLQLPAILSSGSSVEYVPSPFFAEQLTAFELWLEHGGRDRAPPEQLPVVLQVLLSQVHRLRALVLLGRFLDMGSWAVDLALSVGIFPYVLKLLQTTAVDLRATLVFIWAKILAWDANQQVQADLTKDGGFSYFAKQLDARGGAAPGAPAASADSRAQAAFVLASVCRGHAGNQRLLGKEGLPSVILAQLPGALAALGWAGPEAPGARRSHALLVRWLALALGRAVENQPALCRAALQENAHSALASLVRCGEPEVRAAACFALGALILTDPAEEEDERAPGGEDAPDAAHARFRGRARHRLQPAGDAPLPAAAARALARRPWAPPGRTPARSAGAPAATSAPAAAAGVNGTAQAIKANGAEPGRSAGSSPAATPEAQTPPKDAPLAREPSPTTTPAAPRGRGLTPSSSAEALTAPRVLIGSGGSSVGSPGVLVRDGDVYEPALMVGLDDGASTGAGLFASPGRRARGGGLYPGVLGALCTLGQDPAPGVAAAAKDVLRRVGVEFIVLPPTPAPSGPGHKHARFHTGTVSAISSPRPPLSHAQTTSALGLGATRVDSETLAALDRVSSHVLPKAWQPPARSVSAVGSVAGSPTSSPSPPHMTFVATRPTYFLGEVNATGEVPAAYEELPKGMPRSVAGSVASLSGSEAGAGGPHAGAGGGAAAAPAGDASPLSKEWPSPTYAQAAEAFKWPLLAPQALEEPGPPSATWLHEPPPESVRACLARREAGLAACRQLPVTGPGRACLQDVVHTVQTDSDRVAATMLDALRPLLVTADAEGGVRVSRYGNGALVNAWSMPGTGALPQQQARAAPTVALHQLNEAGNELLLTCGADGAVRVWRDYAAKGAQRLATAWQATTLAAAGGRLSDRVYVWDVEREACVRTVRGDLSAGAGRELAPETAFAPVPCIDALALPAGGRSAKVLHVAGSGGAVHVYDLRVAGDCPVASLCHTPTRLAGLVVEPGGVPHRVILGYPSGTLAFADMRGGTGGAGAAQGGGGTGGSGVWKVVEAHRKPYMSAIVGHPHAPLVATATTSQVVKVWSPDGDALGVIRAHTSFLSHRPGPITCLAWAPYDLHLASGGHDRVAAVYRVAAGAPGKPKPAPSPALAATPQASPRVPSAPET